MANELSSTGWTMIAVTTGVICLGIGVVGGRASSKAEVMKEMQHEAVIRNVAEYRYDREARESIFTWTVEIEGKKGSDNENP